ncbi:hypothetical protein P692DRAFT_20708651, partial [Suillus brevipes Sb2]
AVDANGTLKDASEIVWFHDADDSMPISPHPESSSKALPSDAFIAGSRRSGRPTKPSAKVQEAASSAIPAKHLGTATMPPATKRPAPSTIGDDGDDDDDDDMSTNKDEAFVLEEDDNEESKDAEEAYQQIKAFGDSDRDARKCLKKDERTADLRTIFTEEKGHKNVHTGKSEDGWWCNVCKDANLPVQHCFFKGSISTRRTHIA